MLRQFEQVDAVLSDAGTPSKSRRQGSDSGKFLLLPPHSRLSGYLFAASLVVAAGTLVFSGDSFSMQHSLWDHGKRKRQLTLPVCIASVQGPCIAVQQEETPGCGSDTRGPAIRTDAVAK